MKLTEQEKRDKEQENYVPLRFDDDDEDWIDDDEDEWDDEEDM
jgi:hypothetical protein